MLTGRFGDTSGRPYFEGLVLLPRLRLNGHVWFIFDTGADTSLLMPMDARRIGISFSDLQESEKTLGIGGASVNYSERALLAFEGDNQLYGYEIELKICQPSDEILTIPSLLGRDIIDRWRVTYDKPNLRLVADVATADAYHVI